MTAELELAATREFNGITFNCYIEQDGAGEFWATREQIGELLGYADPMRAIAHIHERNSERLNKFSTVTKLSTVEGNRSVTREVTIYNYKGLLEICRYSQQPNAHKVIDVLWDVADEIRRTGSYSILDEEPLNVRARVAEVLQRLALQVSSKAERDVINREAFKFATGHELPKKDKASKTAQSPRYWTAQEIGNTLKWPPDAVMHRAENIGITKKPVNGYWDGDTWYFSKEGRKKFLELVESGIVKIEDGFAHYEDGRKHVYWSFDVCGEVMN